MNYTTLKSSEQENTCVHKSYWIPVFYAMLMIHIGKQERTTGSDVENTELFKIDNKNTTNDLCIY